MTGADIDPSLRSDSPLLPQNNTANAGADQPRGPAAPADAPAAAPGVADGQTADEYSFTKGVGDGRPRTRVVVRPRPLFPEPAEDAAPVGAGTADREPLRPSGADDRETESSSPWTDDIDPVDRLTELAVPTRTFHDWLIADPLNRGALFRAAIAKDPAGVDAASARARAIGYTASRFTEALKAVASGRTETAVDQQTLATTPASDQTTAPSLAPARDSERPRLSERLRLNAADSYYRGTIAGALERYVAYKRSRLAEGELATSQRLAEIEYYRRQHLKIERDLSRYDAIAGFESVSEAVAAATGQFIASLMSPEAYVGGPVRGGALFVRAVWTGLKRIPIEVSADALIQWLSANAVGQDGYDPKRTAVRAATGFAGGAVYGAIAGRAARSAPNPSSITSNAPPGRAMHQTLPKSGAPTGQASRARLGAEPSKTVGTNRAVTSDNRIDSTTNKLLFLVHTIKKMPGYETGSGREFGKVVHRKMKELANKLDVSDVGDLVVEKVYKGGDGPRNRIVRDSVIPDYVLRDKDRNVIAIYDLKTSGGKLDPPRVRKLRRSVGVGDDVPVIELRHDTLEAISR